MTDYFLDGEKIPKVINESEFDVWEYFSDWEGWTCNVEDKDGYECGELICADNRDLMEHLSDAHGIEIER